MVCFQSPNLLYETLLRMQRTVEGGRGWEIMDGLDRTMPAWLGDEPAKRIREHLEHIKSVRAIITIDSVDS